MRRSLFTFAIGSPILIGAQFVQQPRYSSNISSSINPDILVSYKTPDNGTCNTVFSAQKQYTGYIDLPPYTLAPIQQNYSINTFFWFVEARENPQDAPLTIWLNGGPGSSSMFGFWQETGPCQVVTQTDGTYASQARLWGWDRLSNMLFIDQPAQVGFSYDELRNGTDDLLNGDKVSYPATAAPAGQPAYTFVNGTFGSGNLNATSNTTEIAASATWHFLQAWLSTFPQYNPGSTSASALQSAAGVHLFAESYGGKYAPVFAKYFQDQTDRAQADKSLANKTIAINIATLGISDGLVDDLIQNYYNIQFAYNNSYGIAAISQLAQLNSMQTYNTACVPATSNCRQLAATLDPNSDGDQARVNTACYQAYLTCLNTSSAYLNSGRNVYDIRLTNPSPQPDLAYQEYLNDPTVQLSIGARVNYTESNTQVQKAFIGTGDSVRADPLFDLAYLLRRGVRVALMYGDADWICNWMGGEALSLALASLLTDYPVTTTSTSPNSSTTTQPVSGPTPPINAGTGPVGTYASAFPAAGYADIVVNSTYVGGAVRQFGNLSFSRIYDAPHFIPYGQPETAFTVFARIVQGVDISTGGVVNLTSFASKGPSTSNHSNSQLAKQPTPTCWIRDLVDTCDQASIQSIAAGKGVVKGGVWYARQQDVPVPSSSSSVGSSTTSQVVATGVFTATATPSPTKGAGSVLGAPAVAKVLLGVAAVALGTA